MRFDDGIYPEFVEKRTACVVEALGEEFFKGKTLLEVGCGYGYAGELFERMGAKVSSLDVRPEHIDVVRKRYPGRELFVSDLNTDNIHGHYDIVLAFGLLYHLENPTSFLKEATAACDTLILCSIVRDSQNYWAPATKADTAFDQSITDKAVIPTVAWIIGTIETLGFDCKDISSATANVVGNRFDWKRKNDGKDHRDGCYLRRMYCATRR